MKTLRQLFAVFLLTLILTPTAFAGEISTGIADAPPSPPESQTATTGEMSTGIAGDISTSITATDSVTAVVLNLLQSLPPLF